MRLHLAALRPRDAGHKGEAVVPFPLLAAMVLPSAQGASGHWVRAGRRTFEEECLEHGSGMARIGCNVRKADGETAAIAQLEMGLLGSDLLDVGQKVGVEGEL
jgi:hypothetical protein